MQFVRPKMAVLFADHQTLAPETCNRSAFFLAGIFSMRPSEFTISQVRASLGVETADDPGPRASQTWLSFSLLWPLFPTLATASLLGRGET